MSRSVHGVAELLQQGLRLNSLPAHRQRSIAVLFVHRDANVIEDCLQELKKAQFTVDADFVLNLAQCTESLRSHSYDLVIAEYHCPGWKRRQTLELFRQTVPGIPSLFITSSTDEEFIAQLTADATHDYVERENLVQLPSAVRRVLREEKLRSELVKAETALRHWRSQYRALIENPAYAVCRCDLRGKFLEVNEALLTMLGYQTQAELLSAKCNLSIDIGVKPPLAGSAGPMKIEPVETEWIRKNGTTIKVMVSGRGVHDDEGNFNGYEVIAVDITEQRRLEDQLRHQALSDSLTGLANRRGLFDVLQSEISRSKRTGREFSLLLLDLDGLKLVNDGFGHPAGDRALCRLGQTLTDCSRSIDTAARQGGDEFALVLPETGAAAATLVARRICALLGKDIEIPHLTVSVGVASFPKEADSLGTLLYVADKALYTMKNSRHRTRGQSTGTLSTAS